MIDTHTHIYLPEFEDGGEGAYLRAVDAGVEMMVLPNVDLTSAEPLLALHSRHPDRLRTAFGLHPTSVDASWRDTLDAIVPLLESEGCVAVGEVGMDLYWDSTFRSGQMEAFACQLDMAASRSLPVIIHCREALDETLEVIAAGVFGFSSTASPEVPPMQSGLLRLCPAHDSASTAWLRSRTHETSTRPSRR